MDFPDALFIKAMSELDVKRHIAMAKNFASRYALSDIAKSEPYPDRVLLMIKKGRIDNLLATDKIFWK